jgi:hypothetical protein
MADATTRIDVAQSDQLSTSRTADQAERRLRRVGAWLLLYLTLQAELGLAWDRNWHDLIGRDQFWTLPHIMIYSGLGGAGMIALVVSLADTLRYYRHAPGVDDTSTIQVLRFFHAPMGYVLLGFGALTDLVAAPLDNYWHTLYGIDVTLWSPFHIMGTLGGILEGLGILYIFASEAVIERASARQPRRYLGFSLLEWGMLAVLAAFSNLAIPALTAFMPASLGTFRLFTYAFPLALAAGFSLTSALQATRRPWSATLTVLLLSIESLYTQAFVPFAISTSVSVLHYSYRFANRTASFNLTLVLLSLMFLLEAIIFDLVASRKYRQRQAGKVAFDILPHTWLSALVLAVPAAVMPPLLTWFVTTLPAFTTLPLGMFALQAQWLDVLVALPFAWVFGVLAVWCGSVFGDIWYLNRS